MGKYAGNIVFFINEEVEPGIWEEHIVARKYYGDVKRLGAYTQASKYGVGYNFTLNNQLSILADPFANENLYRIRYAEYMGTKWIIQSAEVRDHRLILTLGGEYHEQTSGTTSKT